MTTSLALESSTQIDPSPLYADDDFNTEESMDGDAVLQNIVLPQLNETNEQHLNQADIGTLSRFRDDAHSVRLADDVSAYQDVKDEPSERHNQIPAILLIAISALALATAFTITILSLLYHRRRSSAASSLHTDPRSSFYAVENEPRAWDSLSFSQSITDVSNNKVHSWESLSDDSYINSLDEAINKKASIIHAASKKTRNIARAHSTNTRSSVVITPTNAQSNGDTTVKQ